MPDNLRDRIAAAIWAELLKQREDHPPAADRIADAVILELGLTIQVAGPDGIAYGKHRYVTDWIAND